MDYIHYKESWGLTQIENAEFDRDTIQMVSNVRLFKHVLRLLVIVKEQQNSDVVISSKTWNCHNTKDTIVLWLFTRL
jgi:hypothetical protein